MPRSKRVPVERIHDTPQIQQNPAEPEQKGGVDTRLPLPTLLSQVLVAFTIEFDNEFEHQMPHQTTWGPAAHSRNGPWLASQVMWANFMQYVSEDGVPLRELEDLARITNLNGLKRWGYIVVEPAPADSQTESSRGDQMVRPTRSGRKAQTVWRPLAHMIEQRWQVRFGQDEIDRLHASLQTLVNQLDVEMPRYLPVVRNNLKSEVPDLKGRVPIAAEESNTSLLDLSVLFSQVLLTFTIDFERESNVSLPISANALRVLDEKGVRVRDLPRLTGVSKEAINISVDFLERHGYLVIERDPADSRTKLARLTPKGLQAQNVYHQLPSVIEERWQTRFGKDDMRNLRESLERLVGEPNAQLSPLFKGLESYPDGWRASVRKPDTLPHYPMVLHRGGYPDGS
jgi:DNA-binding MarR family transcriptional regulator